MMGAAIHWGKNQLIEIVDGWLGFWFAPTPLYRISVFRLILGVTLLVFYAIRHMDIDLFFFSSGIVSLETSKTVFEGRFHSPLFWFPETDAGVRLLHGAFLVTLLGIVLGIRTRWFAAAALYLHVIFEQRNFFIVYGADKFAACWLFYLVFTESDAHLSLKSWLQKRRKTWKDLKFSTDVFTPVGVRFVQIQLGVIYFYSGVDKLRGNSWWSGDALWRIVTNGGVIPFDLQWLAHFPMFLVVSSYLTLIWEIFFPMASWVKPIRPYWLLFGVSFHFMIAILLNLPFFSMIVVWAYILFVEDETIRRWVKSIGRVYQRFTSR